MDATDSHSASAPFTMILFGPMQVRVHDRPLSLMRSRKALWLLALLALRHGRPVEREWLAGVLWPDAEYGRGAGNLRSVLSELRSALEDQSDRLQTPARHTLCLDLEGADVDVYAFDAAMIRRNQEDLQQAVALYRGPLLEGCTEEWSAQERMVRALECLEALQILGNRALAAGDHGVAVGYFQRAVSLDPWSDAARRGGMEALAKSGDRNAAMQVYREFTELLRSDPNAVPDEETSALYVRLRAEARQQSRAQAPAVPKEAVVNVAAPPAVSGYLPHALTDLVGRERESIEVAAKLRGSRLVTLTGPGGIGKTRLALDVADEIVQDGSAYPDGVWFVALETLAEGRLVAAQIASVLGLREAAGRPLLESLTDYLRPKRLLLVLDNCEHLLEASAQVIGPLLRECARVRILATSREALGILGETSWQVPALPAPDPQHLPEAPAALLRALRSYESVQFFVARAQACQKDFALTENNARTIAQICFELEGIPLAVELAAARVRVLTVDQIAARLHDRLTLLMGGNRLAQSRQQTLRGALDWSYALLSGPERILLERLSVFVGGWTLEAAEQVGSGGSIEVGETLDLLTGLVDKSLVVFEAREGESDGRFRLLEMIRQYAVERLAARQEATPVRNRHRDWFVRLAEEAALHLVGGDQRSWLRRLDTEYGNLRAALAWSAADGQETELQLVGALWRFWYVRGEHSEGRQYLRNALIREEAQARTTLRARALNGAGALAYDQGEFVTARAFLEESLSIGREREDTSSISIALSNLANVAVAVGEIGLAQALYEEGLALKRALDDRAGIALLLNNLGILVRQQGDYTAAKNYFEESLSIARTLNDRVGMARALLNIGNLAWHQNDPVRERSCFEESLRISRELGNKQNIARSLGNLGRALGDAGEWEAARNCIEESLSLFQEMGHRRGIAQAYGNLGEVLCNQSDYVSARTAYRESMRLFQGLEGPPGGVESLEGLAYVALMQAEARKAVHLWGAAQRQRQAQSIPLPDNRRKVYDQHLEHARSTLDEAVFADAWEVGSAMPWADAVTYALTDASEERQER